MEPENSDRSYWEKDVHVIVKKRDEDIPVYTVKAENGSGKERVLHRNLLLSCEHLPLEYPVEEGKSTPKIKTSKVADKKKIEDNVLICSRRKPMRTQDNSVNEGEDVASSSDEDEEWLGRCRKAADRIEGLLNTHGSLMSSPVGDFTQLNKECGSDTLATDVVSVSDDDSDDTDVRLDSNEVLDESLVDVEISGGTIASGYQEVEDGGHVDIEEDLEQSDNSQDENVDILPLNGRERRMNRRPPRKLTYDNPGIPSYLQ